MQIEQQFVEEGWVPPASDEVLLEASSALLADLDPVPPPTDGDHRDPIDQTVADLHVADRAMARVLRGLAAAGPRDGLSARRQVGLLAGATGRDVGFLDPCR